MLMLGKILEAYPSLAKDVEPVNSPTFYLAALDVLEDGENASHSVNSGKFPREDWRLAVSMGGFLEAGVLNSILTIVWRYAILTYRSNFGLSSRGKAPPAYSDFKHTFNQISRRVVAEGFRIRSLLL